MNSFDIDAEKSTRPQRKRLPPALLRFLPGAAMTEIYKAGQLES